MKKNKPNEKKVLILSIILFFWPLHSSYRPAGKRPLHYSGPIPARQIPQPPMIKSVQKQPNMDVSDETAKKELEETEQLQSERTSDVKEAQKDLPTSGFFASMYATIAPIILITLDKAIGTGTAASTKTIIKEFINRRSFINLKNDIIAQATETVNSGDFDEKIKNKTESIIAIHDIQKNSIEYQKLMNEADTLLHRPTQEKIKQQAKELFAQNKINDPEKHEKETSFSSILAQAAYVGILNVTVNAIGTLFGYATKIGLNALMPDQK